MECLKAECDQSDVIGIFGINNAKSLIVYSDLRIRKWKKRNLRNFKKLDSPSPKFKIIKNAKVTQQKRLVL